MNILGLMLTAMSVMSAEDEWGQWAGPHRDFSMALELPVQRGLEDIREVWRMPLGGGYSGICVHGEVGFARFTNEDNEIVIAFLMESGDEIWRRQFGVPTRDFMDLEFGLGPHSTPLIANNTLYCLGLTGRLSALDVETGDTLWERELWEDGNHTELERGCAASPIAFSDMVIVPMGGQGQAIRAFSMTDGTVRWQSHDSDCAYASPVMVDIAGSPQLVQLMDQEIIGLDPMSGELLWTHDVITRRYVNCTTPVVGPKTDSSCTLFINTGAGLRALRVQAKEGDFKVKELWESRVTICQTTNFVLRENTLFGAKEGGVFVAVDADSGQTLWRSRDLQDCCVISTSGHIIAVEEKGAVAIAEVTRKGIEVQWQKMMLTGRCWVGPIVTKNMLLVRDTQNLIALEIPSNEP